MAANPYLGGTSRYWRRAVTPCNTSAPHCVDVRLTDLLISCKPPHTPTRRGALLAATNEASAGANCKQRDAVAHAGAGA